MADTPQWERCDAAGASCVDIAGETNLSYLATSADLGKTLRCKRMNGLTVVATSDPSLLIQNTPTPPTGAFWLTPDDLRTITPDAVFTGGTAADFQTFVDSIDGSTKRYGGIKWGTKVDFGLSTHLSFSKAGTSGNPIHFFPTSIPVTYAPGGEPTIKGRCVWYNSASYQLFSWLRFDGTHDPSGNLSSWSVGGTHISIDRCASFQSDPTKGTIGWSPVDLGSPYGPGNYFKLTRSKVYNIGEWPVATLSAGGFSPGFYMHGSYTQTIGCEYTDVWYWNCSRIGCLLRGSNGGTFQYIAADHCGAALAFGDNGSTNNDVHHYCGTNSFMTNHNDDFGATAFNTGSGNHLHDSNFFGNHSGNLDPGLGAIVGSGVTQIDPAYVHGCPAGGVSGSSYLSGDPFVIDLRPTDSGLVAASIGARSMIPFS